MGAGRQASHQQEKLNLHADTKGNELHAAVRPLCTMWPLLNFPLSRGRGGWASMCMQTDLLLWHRHPDVHRPNVAQHSPRMRANASARSTTIDCCDAVCVLSTPPPDKRPWGARGQCPNWTARCPIYVLICLSKLGSRRAAAALVPVARIFIQYHQGTCTRMLNRTCIGVHYLVTDGLVQCQPLLHKSLEATDSRSSVHESADRGLYRHISVN